MMDEYHSIMKNDVWEIVPRSEGKSVVTSRWLYKVNHAANGSMEKYKAFFILHTRLSHESQSPVAAPHKPPPV